MREVEDLTLFSMHRPVEDFSTERNSEFSNRDLVQSKKHSVGIVVLSPSTLFRKVCYLEKF